jgi:hypothetical protein
MEIDMNIHPIVRFASQTLGALGGAALTTAVLGTSTPITTSYLMAVLFLVMWALLIALGAYVGFRATTAVCDKLSDSAFEGYGNKVGSALGSVRNFFTRKAA